MHCASETPVLSQQPSAALVAFVRRQVSQAELYDGPERRGELRHLLVMPVTVYPADEKFSPLGLPEAMVIRDISTRGLGLVHEAPLECKLILVRFALAEGETLLGAEILWNRPLGPFYHIGCEITAQLDSSSTWDM